ncbi:N-acetylmuramoyl-L-alanine amidase [Neobacillus sp. 3P2-tot-E-2]|uniref:N-acetylmuramoyl-L-alanine amidase n=1 Tax=Neobacillus sp. 3P2-tot-E-2 TaxID=3132212 RepID=UPI00399FBE1E
MVKIMLDPGHDINTPGKRAPDGSMREFEFNKATALHVVDILSQYNGVEVYYSHELNDGIDTSLDSRAALANRLQVNCLVSIHANAGAASARGIETYIYLNTPTSTDNLARMIHDHTITITGMNNRGVKRADFAILRESNMDALLIECGFMTNNEDLALLKSDEYRRRCAQGIVNGLVQFYGLTKKAAPAQTPTPVTALAGPPEPSVVYEAHLENIGWQGPRRNGETAGTTGQSLRLEALTVRLENTDAQLVMEGHVENKGWTTVRTNGEIFGTIGEGLRLEAIRIDSDQLTVLYRVHVQNIGWTDWKRNGEVAGTTGQALRIEAVEIKLG